MQSQQITPALPPIYERGNKPVTFQSHKPGIPVIRVRHGEQIRFELCEDGWLKKAKPLQEYRELALQLLEVGLPNDEYRILPAKHQSLRLMWRAARVYCEGDYLRASQLLMKARKALGFEGDQSLWYGMEIFNAYNGFNHCLMEAEVKPGTVLAVWEAQAPWWTGGDWPGSGLLGKMMDRLTAPWKGIVQEERDKATARLAAVSDFRRSFGVTPREALASPEDRAKVMAAYAQAPDSDGVRRRLEALRIARQSGHLLPAHK